MRATVAALIDIGPKDELVGTMASHKHGRYTAEALARRRELAALIRTMRALAGADEAE